MPQTCTICTHPQRDDIDRALLSFNTSLRNIAEQYGVSTTCLHRHLSNHLAEEYALAKRERAERTITTIEEITGRLTQIMRGDITDLLNDQGRFDIDDIRDRGLGGLIKSVTIEQQKANGTSPPADIIKVEMYSALDAAKSLGSMWVKLKINDDANRRLEAQKRVAKQNLDEFMAIGLSFDEAIIEVEKDLPGARLLLNG